MYPLDPLTPAEITATAKLVQHHNLKDSVHFKNITLIEPPKRDLRQYLAAERKGAALKSLALPRRASALYYHRGNHRGTADLFVATVNLNKSEVETIEKLDPRYHGQADMDEVLEVRNSCLSHPEVLERIRQYGLPDELQVVCDTWPYGRDNDEFSRRLSQCYLYAKNRSHPGSNAYDNPLPFSPIIDYCTKEFVDIIELPLGADHSVTPAAEHSPHKPKEWHHDLHSQPTRTDLKPLTVQQPRGASFSVDGHLIHWQKWRFRLGFNWREGMVLHDVTYDGRELFHRLSLSEMFVPWRPTDTVLTQECL